MTDTARDVLAMLRRHYLPENRPSAGIFAPEIAAPGGSRRADLIFQGCTAAAGHELVGHEVKVTRADLAAELADLTKSDPWQRYCDRWWLVVPDPAMVEGFDLPTTWGVYGPPSGRRTRSMTVLVPAPNLTPHDQAPAFRTIATWLHWKHDQQVQQRAAVEQRAHKAEDHARDLAARVPREDSTPPRPQALVDEIVRRLGGPHPAHGDRIGDWSREVRVDDVVEALTDLAATRNATRMERYHLQAAARELTRALASVDRGEVAKLARAVDEAQAAAS